MSSGFAALFLLIAVSVTLCEASNRCDSWCNSYTCSIGSCYGCSVCHELVKGDICAGWCNPYTTMFQHCKGCEPKVELVERRLIVGTKGSGSCVQRCNPAGQDSIEFYDADLNVALEQNYTYELGFEGSDPHKIYEQCVEAVGDLYAPTVTFVNYTEDNYTYGYCNSKCEFVDVIGLSGPAVTTTLYSKAEDTLEKTPPLTCNERPYYVYYCTPEVYYGGRGCTKRPGWSVGTLREDCLEVQEDSWPTYNGTGSYNKCVPWNVTESYKKQPVDSYEGKPTARDISFTVFRDFSSNPSVLQANTIYGLKQICTAAPGETRETSTKVEWYVWDSKKVSCEGAPIVSYYIDGVMAPDYYAMEQCKEAGVLSPQNLAILEDKYPHADAARRRALEARRGLAHKRGLQSKNGKGRFPDRHVGADQIKPLVHVSVPE